MDMKTMANSAVTISEKISLHGVNDSTIFGGDSLYDVDLSSKIKLARDILSCLRFLGPYMTEQQVLSMYYHKLGLFGVAFYCAAKSNDLVADELIDPEEDAILEAFSNIETSWDGMTMLAPLATDEYQVKIIQKEQSNESIQEMFDAFNYDDFIPVIQKKG